MSTHTQYILNIIIACSVGLFIASCQSHEQKADDAFEHVKEEKKVAKDGGISEETAQQPILQETVPQETKKTEVVPKTVSQDEWSKFRAETEKKILANESKIKLIKATPGTSAKLLEELSSKEKDYNDLRRKLDEYNEDMKEALGKFKVKINHEVSEISIDLNDLTIKNKK